MGVPAARLSETSSPTYPVRMATLAGSVVPNALRRLEVKPPYQLKHL